MKYHLKLSFMLVLLFFTAIQAFAQIEKIHKIDSTNDNYGGLYVTPKYTYFSNTKKEYGKELWRTDGTEKGTIQILNTQNGKLEVGSESFKTCFYDSVQNKLYFLGWEKNSGWELWMTDGTESGTKLVIDLNPVLINKTTQPLSTTIHSMWIENNNLTILHTDSGDSFEALHPLLLSSINIANNKIDTLCIFPPRTYTKLGVLHLKNGTVLQAGNLLYFLDKNYRISDSLSFNFNYSLSSKLSDDRVLYLTLYDTTASQYYIWSTDGTLKETNRLVRVQQGVTPLYSTSERIHYLAAKSFGSGGTLNFCIYHINSREIDTIFQINNMNWVRALELKNAGQRIILAIEGDLYGIEPWYWDVTTNEVRMLKNINPLFYNSSINDYYLKSIANKDHLYFFADDAVHGNELWTTDGTEAGTKLVQDLNPYGGWITPVFVSGTNEQFYFVGWNGKNDRSLYRYIYPKSSTNIDLPSDIQESKSYTHFDNGQLTLFLNGELSIENITEVCLLDYLGRQTSVSHTSPSESTIHISIKNTLSSGVYFAVVKTNHKFITVPVYISTP